GLTASASSSQKKCHGFFPVALQKNKAVIYPALRSRSLRRSEDGWVPQALQPETISARRWRSLSSKLDQRRPGPCDSICRSVLDRIGVTLRFTPDSAVSELAVDVPLAKEPLDAMLTSSLRSESIPLPTPAGFELMLRASVPPTMGPVAPVPCVIWAVVGVILRSVSARCITGPVSHLDRYLFS